MRSLVAEMVGVLGHKRAPAFAQGFGLAGKDHRMGGVLRPPLLLWNVLFWGIRDKRRVAWPEVTQSSLAYRCVSL
jgi:hypothetical protein